MSYVHQNTTSGSALDDLAAVAGVAGWPLAQVESSTPALASPFQGEDAAAAALAAGASEAAGLWALRTGEDQAVAVETREAAASLVSFLFQRFDDPARAPSRAAPATAANGFLPTGDGRFVYIHPSFDESVGHLKMLGCADTPQAVRAALAQPDPDGHVGARNGLRTGVEADPSPATSLPPGRSARTAAGAR